MSLEATNKLFDAVYYNPTNKQQSYFEALGYPELESLYATPAKEEEVIYEPEQRHVTTVGQVPQTDGLEPVMQQALALLLSDPNIKDNIRVTSKKRSPRYAGDKSNHTRGMAFDIVPIDGDFDNLRRNIARNKELITYLKQAGLGIISEVTPEEQRHYKASDANLHFGPDRAALQGVDQILREYGYA